MDTGIRFDSFFRNPPKGKSSPYKLLSLSLKNTKYIKNRKLKTAKTIKTIPQVINFPLVVFTAPTGWERAEEVSDEVEMTEDVLEDDEDGREVVPSG